LGLRYVSLGVWQQIEWKQVGANLWQQTAQPNEIYFVNGERTPPDGIPLRGTATYNLAKFITMDRLPALDNLSQSEISNALILKADFGASTMSADLNIPVHSYPSGDQSEVYYDPGFLASGSAPFSRADQFSIPLTGTSSADPKQPAKSLSGGVQGAFFGPSGENIGGLLSLSPQGEATITVPFAAVRQ
jgi:hypothetical protein